MGPLRAAAALLAACALIWLIWPAAQGGEGGAGLDGYAETGPEAVTPEAAMGEDPSLRGNQGPPVDVPDGETYTFRFVVRHAEHDALLGGIRIDEVDGDYLGTTDDYGELEIEYAAKRLKYEAWAKGFASRTGHARAGDEIVLFMSPGVPVKGLLLEAESRRAVAGAVIKAWDDDAGLFVSGGVPTDEKGRFELAGIRLHHPFTLIVQAEEMVPMRWRGIVHDTPAEIEVLVQMAGIVRGTVKDTAGEPLDGRPVFLLQPGRRIPGEERPYDPWRDKDPPRPADVDRVKLETPRVVTDEMGRFEFKGVVFGEPVFAVVQADARERLRSNTIVLTEKTPEVDLELDQVKRGTLKLFFLDMSGATVEDARLRIEGSLNDFVLDPKVKAGPLGARVYDDFPSGLWTVIAQTPNGPKVRKSFMLKPEGSVEVRLKTVLGGFFMGRVVGEAGQPIMGARVEWRAQGGDPNVRVVTKGGGSFKIQGIRGDADDVVVTPPPSYDMRARYEKVELGRVGVDQKGYVITLPERPMVEGFVFARAPIADLRIDIANDQFRKTLWRKLGEGGRFTMRKPPPGKGIVIFRAKDLAPTVVSYSNPDQLDHKLHRVWLDDSRRIPVTVRAKSRPIAGARIRPADPRIGGLWRTDINGEAELAGLPPAGAIVVVDTDWSVPKTHRVGASAAGTRYQLTLGESAGILEGTVTSYRTPGYTLWAVPVDRRDAKRLGLKPVKMTRDGMGWFSERLLPGRYRLMVLWHQRPMRYLRQVTVTALKRTRYGR